MTGGHDSPALGVRRYFDTHRARRPGQHDQPLPMRGVKIFPPRIALSYLSKANSHSAPQNGPVRPQNGTEGIYPVPS